MTPQIHGFVNTYYNFNGTISIPAFLDSWSFGYMACHVLG
jgi:hypothetical protein